MGGASRPERAATLNSQINETLINHLTKLLEEKTTAKNIPRLPEMPSSPRAPESKSTGQSSQERCYDQPDSGSFFRAFEPVNLDDHMSRNLVPPPIFRTDLTDSESSSTSSKQNRSDALIKELDELCHRVMSKRRKTESTDEDVKNGPALFTYVDDE